MERMTLEEARKHRKLTQVQLASLADMQQSDISALETGRRQQPEIATMRKLANALKMTALLSVAGLVFEERSEP